MSGRVRCRHGFPSEICPSCAGLDEPNPLVSVEAKALIKLSARYAKALAIVEAARPLQCFRSPVYAGSTDCGQCVACRVRAALTAFDEVADK